MKNAVIYTCLVGSYDHLQQPEKPDPRFDYICFSNDAADKRIGVWEVRPFDYHNANSTRESRFPKLQPDKVLPEYEYSLYIDANQRLTEALQDHCLDLMAKGTKCAMVPHPTRDCVYQEAHFLTGEICCGIKGFIQVLRMVSLLIKEKYPEHNGLICGCCILRKHNEPSVIAFSDKWWELYQNYSQRDQMSANYALWKVNLQPDVLWGKDFYYTFSKPHIHQIGKNFKSPLWKIILSYMLIAILKTQYTVHGISWSRWVNHE